MTGLDAVETALAGAPRVREAAAAVRGGRIVGYVVPGPDAAATVAWRDAFREIYRAPAASGFDVRGWVSSIDGAPLPEPDMRAWRDATIATLRREPVGRVLEIGCGNGLLATELVGGCAGYVGTDIVADGLDGVRAALDAIAPGKAALHVLDATGIGALDGPFDLVVLNSVIQYFPDARYLVDVLTRAVALLAPGGRLFVGDVRHRGLADRLYAERAYARLADPTPEKVDRIVRVNRHAEAELLVDPAFFGAFAARAGLVAEVEPKPGRYDNELSRYRFDATMFRAHGHAAVAAVRVHDRADLDDEAVGALLRSGATPVVLRGVPNARLAPDETGALHPEDLRDRAAEHGYACRLDWSGGGSAYDAYLSRSGPVASLPRPAPPADLYSLVGVPRQSAAGGVDRADQKGIDERHADAVRAHAAGVLAPHLVPARVVIVDALPRTPGGAVNRDALPEA